MTFGGSDDRYVEPGLEINYHPVANFTREWNMRLSGAYLVYKDQWGAIDFPKQPSFQECDEFNERLSHCKDW